MFEKQKANILFDKLLKRPDISKAYAMVPQSDSWYDTITTVHNSLAEIQKLDHQVLEITSHDNLKLKAIYYPNNEENKKNVTVICVHGYTSHAEREWAFPGLFYHSLGYNVLIPYQRAHGLSEGEYISFSAMEQLDMRKWVNKVNEIDSSTQIIIHGLSMGGGIVLQLINKEMKNVKCLISDAPSISVSNFFRRRSENIFKKNNDKIYYYLAKRYQKEFKVNVEDYDGYETIKEAKYPLLLAAGSKENRINSFNKLKESSPLGVDIVILKGCNHGNGMYKKTEEFQSAIKDFLSKYIDK